MLVDGSELSDNVVMEPVERDQHGTSSRRLADEPSFCKGVLLQHPVFKGPYITLLCLIMPVEWSKIEIARTTQVGALTFEDIMDDDGCKVEE